MKTEAVQLKRVEVAVLGMDCAECTMHVQHAIAALPGVAQVEVFLASEKALVQLDPAQVSLEQIRQAVTEAGYRAPDGPVWRAAGTAAQAAAGQSFVRPVLRLVGGVLAAVLFVVVIGEWLGLFEAVTRRVPWPVGLALVLVFGYPVFMNVARAALRRQVISHTLMTVGVIAALVVGEWATAAVVVFFMRMGDYVEHFTTERARQAVKDLAALAPQTARLELDGVEQELPAAQVRPGDVVVIRPGELVPVDGEVLTGHAAVNQAAITGEALPVEVGPGATVYATALVQYGSLRVRAVQVGAETTFGKVVRLVEEAEAQRARVQQLADRASAWYLPVVAVIAGVTFAVRRDPLATAAVLVVACSCSFALATPIAMLASIGSAARRGLLIKGGKYLERLDQADTLLIDKTGTLTLGEPYISDVAVLPGLERSALLRLAASVERYSEHPLAGAVRALARREGLSLLEPQDFSAQPGQGVQAELDGRQVTVGSRRMFAALPEALEQQAAELEAQGKSLLVVGVDGQVRGLLAAADRMRPDAPQALRRLRELGLRRIELLTGDHAQAAQALADALGADLEITVNAGLLPQDKIAIVRRLQAEGRRVVMVGDGVNDAPALAQADVGMAICGAGASDIAIEAAHVVLLRDDWQLAPEAVEIARRTMRVVRGNLGFTLLYNVVGLSLAAVGLLPPILAAAAQSLPDLGILANSARLLRRR